MGLFDFFRKKPPTSQPEDNTVSLPQLCYDIAYRVLPYYVFNDLEKLTTLCNATPTSAGPFFYLMACTMREIHPDVEVARIFKWHNGLFDETRQFLAFEYPVPPAIDMFDMKVEDFSNVSKRIVLAPHWSAILLGNEPEYYILGQSPIGGGTTVRSMLRDGCNCNLGPGPEPSLDGFLDAIRERQGSK